MRLCITPSSLEGKVKAIASKSDAHRAIICASLTKGETRVYIPETNEDIDATLNCIKAMGANVTKEGNCFVISAPDVYNESCTLDCGESGSTLRFMIPVAAALGIKTTFKGRGRLGLRPLKPIIDLLKQKGIEFSSDTLPFTMNGKLTGGSFEIQADVSSQFITGLLFALSVLPQKSTVELTTRLESKAYVDMTVDILKKFGMNIEKTLNGYIIDGTLKTSGEYIVEGDWSNAAFFLVGGALSGSVRVTGLDMSSKQSDKAITDILKIAGAKVYTDGDAVCVEKSNLKPFSLDVSQCPDLFPIVAILACAIDGETTLYNAKRLRLKESDRIEATRKLITSLGGEARESEDSLTIYGKGSLSGGIAEGFGDHRIVMSALIASCICSGSVTLNGAEAMNKSYPDFLKHFESVGGKTDVI